MQRQFMVVILLLLALATAGALLFSEQEQQSRPQFTQHALLTEIDKSFAHTKRLDLARIQIIKQNTVLLNAMKENGEWYTQHLSASLRFPINKDLLIAFVRKLKAADVIEYKSAQPEHHKTLNLQDSDKSDAQSTELLLQKTDGSRIVLLLGKKASSGYGQYVRFAGQNQMMLIDTVLDVPSNQGAWLKK